MKRKLFLLTAIMLSLSIFLSACGQKDKDFKLVIGEEKGKAAGLALINQAFDVNETDASVDYQARPATFFQDGTTGETVTLEPDRVYIVKAAPEIGETEYYYAEVDAVTGVAFRAERSMSGIVLTEDQQKQAEALGTLEECDLNDLLPAQQDAQTIVADLIEKRLEKDIPILRIYPDMIESDSVDFPKAMLEYFVIMQNGKVYNLTLCWPTMELIQVYIRD